MKEKILLLILDGVGVAPSHQGNAVSIAQPQTLIKLWERNPHTYLEASAEDVGLAANTNGNSEIGHLTIGSGKINYQNLLKINQSIEKEKFFQNNVLKNILEHCKRNNSDVHLMACLSDGGVHSHISHILATLKFFSINNFQGNVLLHMFTDGRDVTPRSAQTFFKTLEKNILKLKTGRISTICGRAYAMDRNNDLEKTQKAYDLLMFAKGNISRSWQECLTEAYNRGEIDEYITPTVIRKKDEKTTIEKNDSVIFLNFRPDRALQLSRAINNVKEKNLFFAGMVEYEKNFPQNVIFPKEYITLPIGRVIANMGLRQLRIAESEKYPHVTYFTNGGLPIQYTGEDRINIPSANVPTYDLKPEMSAVEIMNTLIERLHKKYDYKFIVANIANGDMVGHTGNINAGVKAIKVVDYVVNNIIKTAKLNNWSIIITADHGNVERMIDTETNEILTEHTQNPVPFLLISPQKRSIKQNKKTKNSLQDIAPTILDIMHIKKPSVMTGNSLLS